MLPSRHPAFTSSELGPLILVPLSGYISESLHECPVAWRSSSSGRKAGRSLDSGGKEEAAGIVFAGMVFSCCSWEC